MRHPRRGRKPPGRGYFVTLEGKNPKYMVIDPPVFLKPGVLAKDKGASGLRLMSFPKEVVSHWVSGSADVSRELEPRPERGA